MIRSLMQLCIQVSDNCLTNLFCEPFLERGLEEMPCNFSIWIIVQNGKFFRIGVVVEPQLDFRTPGQSGVEHWCHVDVTQVDGLETPADGLTRVLAATPRGGEDELGSRLVDDFLQDIQVLGSNGIDCVATTAKEFVPVEHSVDINEYDFLQWSSLTERKRRESNPETTS